MKKMIMVLLALTLILCSVNVTVGLAAPEIQFIAGVTDLYISGNAVVGGVLTAHYKYVPIAGEKESGTTISWNRGSVHKGDTSGEPVIQKAAPIESGATYTVTEADTGFFIFATITVKQAASGKTKAYCSNKVKIQNGTGVSVNTPMIIAVDTNGASVGGTLRAVYGFSSNATSEDQSTVQWLESTSKTGVYTPIENATGPTYMVEFGKKYIKCAVTAKDGNGNIGEKVESINTVTVDNVAFFSNVSTVTSTFNYRQYTRIVVDGIENEDLFNWGGIEETLYFDLFEVKNFNRLYIVESDCDQIYNFWCSDDLETWTPIAENLTATSKVLNQSLSEMVKTRYVKMKISCTKGIKINEVAFILEHHIPEAQNVSVLTNENTRVDDAIYGIYDFKGTDNESGTECNWYSAEKQDGKFEKISTGDSLVIKDELLGKYVKFGVIPKDALGQVGMEQFSQTIGPIRAQISLIPTPPICESIKISGVAFPNETLVGEYQYFDANDDSENKAGTIYVWEREKSGSRKLIESATTNTYKVTQDDIGCNIYFGVKPCSIEEPYYPDDFYYSAPIAASNFFALYDRDALTIDGNLDSITKSLVLPIKGAVKQSDITWKSSDDSVISPSGLVKRKSTNQSVKLTATIKHKDYDYTASKEFDCTVLAAETPKSSGGGSTGGRRNPVSVPYFTKSEAGIDNPASGVGGSVEETTVFTDVPKSHWAYSYIDELVKAGAISPNQGGIFEPDRPIKREEAIKEIVEILNLSKDITGSYFEDVDESEWFAQYVNAAKKYGIVNGIGERLFGAGLSLSREDLSCMVYNAIKDRKEITNEVCDFADCADIDSYAREAVNYLRQTGVVSGKGNNMFMPKSIVTRAEAAKIMCALKGGQNQ